MLYYMGCLYYSGARYLHTRVSYRNSQPIETITVTLVLGVVYLDRTRRTESGKRDRRGARSPWTSFCCNVNVRPERRLGTRQVLGLFHTKMAKSSFSKKDYNFSSFWIGKAPTSWYPRNQVSETVHNSQSKTKQVNFRVKIERYLTRPRGKAFILPRPSGVLYEWLWTCE